ncbi:MAG TPA: hypothetical protein VE980_11775 [Pyrinomonadaceae bacterium]|nr:hypothetical protein [Pyrinomonadaceae bacterium]
MSVFSLSFCAFCAFCGYISAAESSNTACFPETVHEVVTCYSRNRNPFPLGPAALNFHWAISLIEQVGSEAELWDDKRSAVEALAIAADLLWDRKRSGEVRTGSLKKLINIKRQWDPQKLFSQSAIDSVTLVEKTTYG